MNRLVLFFIILGFASPSWSQFMGPNWGKNNRTQIPSIRNPQISAGTVFLGGYSTQNTDHSDETEDEHAAHSGLQTGLQVQEIEIRFMSNVDPFFRLELGLTGHTHEGVMELGFEEAFLTTIAIPDLTLRAGQFMMNFGKANLMHVHARHFIEAPLLLTELLGSEHLIGTGVSADYLAPLPFFTELNLQAVKANWKSGAHAHGASPDETHQKMPLISVIWRISKPFLKWEMPTPWNWAAAIWPLKTTTGIGTTLGAPISLLNGSPSSQVVTRALNGIPNTFLPNPMKAIATAFTPVCVTRFGNNGGRNFVRHASASSSPKATDVIEVRPSLPSRPANAQSFVYNMAQGVHLMPSQETTMITNTNTIIPFLNPHSPTIFFYNL